MIAASATAQQPQAHHWAIVLHGGAGVIERATMNPNTEAAYRASLAQATQAAAQVLDKGWSSLDAVEAAIKILEDDPLFNAGRGADFAADGKNELDAAIMDGSNFKAGAVGDVTRTRHPISLARAVMEKSQHVFLVGQGADEFSVYVGLEQVDPSYFFTERRWQSLVKQLKKEGLPIPPRPAGAPRRRLCLRLKSSPRTRTNMAPSVSSPWTARGTWPQAPRREARKPSAGGVSAIRRSSAREPTLRISPALSRPRALASISSG